MIVVGLILVLYTILKKEEQELATKLIGVSFVVGLAFTANDVTIYGLAIFIVATIITKLDFLENLAAIFWKNDGYWKYRIAFSKASDEELRNKATNELVDIESSERQKPITGEQVNRILHTEQAILNQLVLGGSGLFVPHHLRPNLKLQFGDKKTVVDALASGPNSDYIVEIKALNKSTFSKGTFMHWLHQLQGSMDLYRNINRRKGIEINIRGLLIIPNDPSLPDSFDQDISVLKYDLATNEFVNREQIARWINE